ncbi:pentatricopeptide repeat-containing protein At1g06140, mitochondrial-like [Magnolia sinica]|uniref:pentatricopeptide repeat-containing protein At1g06140, mitochondrial-like n=1 Tax=Magnolia sinica TaxID=86752 RepID=UPI00265B46F1|nr:pentatricopeptide repeat-containing protein At1g06140, mitochondrial-like [Magnolia sinica]
MKTGRLEHQVPNNPSEMSVFIPLQSVTAFAPSRKQYHLFPPSIPLSLVKYERSLIIGKSMQPNCKSSDSEEAHFKNSEILNKRTRFFDIEGGNSKKFGFLKNPALVADVSSMGSVIREWTEIGLYEDAIGLYLEILSFGVPADEFSCFPCLIKAFGKLRDLGKAKQIHGHVLKIGVAKDVYIHNSLFAMYWECGAVDDAVDRFDRMPELDTVSWNIMISGFNRSMRPLAALKFFSQMRDSGMKPNRVTCLSALSACASCGSLATGREIHAFVVKNGLDSDVALVSGIVDMYMKCGDLTNAEHAFTRTRIGSNTVAWNAMISGYVYNRCPVEALILFHKMLVLGVESDFPTMVSILVSCSHLSDLEVGRQIHGYLITNGLQNDVRVETAVLDMYFKCGDIEAGLKIFKQFPNKNSVTWGAIISGCAQNSLPAKALELFSQFISVGGRADFLTVISVLRACSSMSLKLNGMEIHGFSIKMGFDSDVFVGGALTDMYAKCGDIRSARKVLLRLPKRDVVAWNALIAGYTQNDYTDNALMGFRDMQLEHVGPNTVTISCILTVCSRLSAFVLCKQIHCYILRNGLELNVPVSNSLLATYARCGDINSALYLFRKMPEKDEISWNSMISGLGMHGCTDEVFALFYEMKAVGMKPDHITYTSVLSACSHTGRVNEGWQHFRSMSNEYGILPTLEQYTCMVDLLGRAGHLDGAYDLIMHMPCEPDAYVWGSLLRSCKIHGDKLLAEQVASQIFRFNARSTGYHVLLSNLYEDFGEWDDVSRIRAGMKDTGLKKRPGCSWIEVNNEVHVFLAGDRSHSQSEDIYAVLEILTENIEEEGCSP